MNRLLIGLVALILLAGGMYLLKEKPAAQNSQAFDPKNASFALDDQIIALANGVEERVIPGSSAKIVTRYFGNEAVGDLNGDGRPDLAFLVSRETGGSGIFYYVVVILGTAEGHKTTNAFFIGDRIAPQSTEIHSDSKELHVNYAMRNEGEPMTTPPSRGAVLLLKVTDEGVLEGLMK